MLNHVLPSEKVKIKRSVSKYLHPNHPKMPTSKEGEIPPTSPTLVQQLELQEEPRCTFALAILQRLYDFSLSWSTSLQSYQAQPILLGSTNDIHDKPSKHHDTLIIIIDVGYHSYLGITHTTIFIWVMKQPTYEACRINCSIFRQLWMLRILFLHVWPI